MGVKKMKIKSKQEEFNKKEEYNNQQQDKRPTKEEINYEKESLKVLISKQNDFLASFYKEKDELLSENRRLSMENANLIRTISLNHNYINYLSNSFWWKLTFPLRFIYRNFKNKSIDYQFVKNINDNIEIIDSTISIIINTYNPGEEFKIQLDYLKKQKGIKELEIIIIDRGSTDNTKKYAKEENATFIDMKNNDLTDSEAYEKILPSIKGDYIVLIEQNKIVDSNYWIYQSIIPIKENMAVSTVFFKEDISIVKDTSCYKELKERMVEIADEQVLFFPANRDAIQYFSPIILEKSCILVKKRISNIFLI